MSEQYDVFVSYSHVDGDWVRHLAQLLHDEGLSVWFDEWEIGAGDVLVHKLDDGIGGAKTGILILTEETLARPIVR